MCNIFCRIADENATQKASDMLAVGAKPALVSMCCAVPMVMTTVPNAGKHSHRSSADVQAICSTGPSVMPVHSGTMTAA